MRNTNCQKNIVQFLSNKFNIIVFFFFAYAPVAKTAHISVQFLSSIEIKKKKVWCDFIKHIKELFNVFFLCLNFNTYVCTMKSNYRKKKIVIESAIKI